MLLCGSQVQVVPMRVELVRGQLVCMCVSRLRHSSYRTLCKLHKAECGSAREVAPTWQQWFSDLVLLHGGYNGLGRVAGAGPRLGGPLRRLVQNSKPRVL